MSDEFQIDPEGTETRVIHDLCDFSGLEVLEVGAGDGRLTWRYAAETTSVVALDPNPLYIERGMAETPDRLRDRVTFLEADITQADLPAHGFDVALFSWCL